VLGKKLEVADFSTVSEALGLPYDAFVSVVIMHSGAFCHSVVIVDNTTFVSRKKRWLD
jgi:hypothetical protein